MVKWELSPTKILGYLQMNTTYTLARHQNTKFYLFLMLKAYFFFHQKFIRLLSIIIDQKLRYNLNYFTAVSNRAGVLTLAVFVSIRMKKKSNNFFIYLFRYTTIYPR